MQVDVKGRVSADSADMLLRLAIEGAGILRLSEHVVADAIQRNGSNRYCRMFKIRKNIPCGLYSHPVAIRLQRLKHFSTF